MVSQKSKVQKQVKEVTILARVEFKNDPRKVVYQCLSSNGVDKYNTFLFDGKACSCECKATKPCYHMTGCEVKEQARIMAQVKEQAIEKAVDLQEYKAIIREAEEAANRRAAMDIQFNPWFA